MDWNHQKFVDYRKSISEKIKFKDESNESKASFKFMFNSLKNKGLELEFWISDASNEIRTAFKEEFNLSDDLI